MTPRTRNGRRNRGSHRPAPYSRLNLADWERSAAGYEARHARTLARERGKAWGTFRIPERRLHLLGDVRGRDVLELGCGAGWWSTVLAQEGARVVGLDFSPTRLAQARELMRAAGVTFPLVQARAERIPYPARRFDVVLSDYGATTFADPYRTIPEVARVLRTGGVFVFAHASPFRSLSENLQTDRLSRRMGRDYFGLHTLRRPGNVEFQLPYGEWIRLFASCGLTVERLVEPVAPRAPQSTYLSRHDQEWARHWPFEAIWKLRRVRVSARAEFSRISRIRWH